MMTLLPIMMFFYVVLDCDIMYYISGYIVQSFRQKGKRGNLFQYTSLFQNCRNVNYQSRRNEYHQEGSKGGRRNKRLGDSKRLTSCSAININNLIFIMLPTIRDCMCIVISFPIIVCVI